MPFTVQDLGLLEYDEGDEGDPWRSSCLTEFSICWYFDWRYGAIFVGYFEGVKAISTDRTTYDKGTGL